MTAALATGRYRRPGRLRAALGVLAGALVLLVLAGSPASAHANLLDSNPADGALLDRAPGELVLHMSESVELAGTTVVITDGHGGQIAAGPVRLRRGSATGTEEPSTLTVPLPPLPTDTYRVAWATLSSDDLHPTRGVVVFGVRRAVAAASAPTDPPPGAAESVARAVGFVGLSAALGALVLLALLRRTGPAAGPALDGARRRLRVTQAVGAGIAVAADTALLVAQSAGSGTGTLATAVRLLGSGYGARWWCHEAAILALLAAAALGARRDRRPEPGRRLPAAGVIAVVAAIGVTAGLLGHPASAGPLWVAVDAAHQCAAWIWTGGVLAAAVALLGRSGERRALAGLVLRRFSAVAVAGVLVLAMTGLLLAGHAVASVDALLFSAYGRVLLVKIGLAVLVGAAGLVNTVLLHRKRAGGPAARPLVAVVCAEAVLGALLLGSAATLGSASPPSGSAWQAGPAPSTLSTSQADDLVESVAVTPNTPDGANFVTAQIFDTRKPAPAPVSEVTITLRSADGVVVSGTARPGSNGAYVLPTDRLGAGQWRITVAVGRLGLATAVSTTDWDVRGGPAHRTPVVSLDPLAPVLWTVALGVLGLAVATALVWSVRRRTGSRVPSPAATDPDEREPDAAREPARAHR